MATFSYDMNFGRNRTASVGAIAAIAAFALSMIVCASGSLFAQPEAKEFRDSKGKEFWVTFMQSVGGRGDREDADMRLYISADEPTIVSITFNGDGRSVDVTIPRSNVTVEVNMNTLFGSQVELNEFDLNVSSKSFHVVSDQEFTLYGVAVRLQSSDAFLALPDDALTRKYIVLSYPNGYQSGGQPGFPQGFDQPSEFAVIATEDGTEVSIRPTANLNGRLTLDPFVVRLNEGEVYFAQASLIGAQDVSGTSIRSTKPVAVFGGNKRTAIPTSVGNFRDHLVEQMPPLESWGTSAILTPHFDVTPGVPYSAVARVVAATDNTRWQIDGVDQSPLNAGEVFEFPMTEDPNLVTASGPIMVAQYEHSVGRFVGSQFELGDPFMMLIPPPEQYDTSYAFQSITHELFERHFINVVVPSPAKSSLRLDGVPVVVAYRNVPGTNYSYAQIELNAGSHYVTCDSSFGLYSYGYGRANSYGYAGGTLFRELVVDFESPFITVDRYCGELSGTAIDDRITDTGIDSCYVVDSGTSNANVKIRPFSSGTDSVFYSATLVDPYQDGVAMIKAVDSAGRSVTLRSQIAGFTLGTTRMQGGRAEQNDIVSYNGQRVCRKVEIVNYGRFPRTVDDVRVTPGSVLYSLSPSMGFTLQPGESRTVEFCFDGGVDTLLNVAFNIGDSCVDRRLADFTVYSIIDTLPPANAGRAGSCDETISVLFSDQEGKYRGISDVEVLSAENAVATVSPGPQLRPAAQVALELAPIDAFQDMLYEVELTDAAGNVTRLIDTVGGFTMSAIDIPNDRQVSSRLGVAWGTDSLDFLGRRCDSILLRNYGYRDLVIDHAMLEGNREFSIPPAQFPLRILRGDSVYLSVCMEGRFAGDLVDTILIVDTCGRWDRIPMKTPVGFGFGYGEDYCGQSLTIQAYAPAKQTFLTSPFPNPTIAGSAVGLDIGLSRDEVVTIDVMDMNGERRLRVLKDEGMKGGVHRLRFEALRLESGIYFCRMTTGTGASYVTKMVVAE